MSDPWRPLFSTSVAKHGRVIAYTIVLVRAVLMTVLFFGGCIVGLAFSLWKWRDPSVPATLSHFYAPIACWLAGVRVIRQSWEITQRDASAVFVANQQAVFDLAAFGDPLPPKCVSANKSELKWYPFLGCFLHASGGVWVDRKRRAPAVAALDEAVERLKASEISLFIYPEGKIACASCQNSHARVQAREIRRPSRCCRSRRARSTPPSRAGDRLCPSCARARSS